MLINSRAKTFSPYKLSSQNTFSIMQLKRYLSKSKSWTPKCSLHSNLQFVTQAFKHFKSQTQVEKTPVIELYSNPDELVHKLRTKHDTNVH